ncbi:hypothetical protein [Candidatus Leptofilum sp.]|uniref:hypothetical protein n=1 Tax=Candidatus Leptofilum sp. TaxID=3241576 RepID=UPI003B5C75D2
MKKLNGPVLSTSQFLRFFEYVKREGYKVSGNDAITLKFTQTKTNLINYNDLLAAILLFGTPKVSLPPYLSKEIDAEELVKEDLIEFIDLNSFENIRNTRHSLSAHYEKGYEICRSLESDPAVGDLFNVSDINILRNLSSSFGLEEIEDLSLWDLKSFDGSLNNAFKSSQNLDRQLLVDEIKWHHQHLDKILQPITTGLSGIFKFYVGENANWYFASYLEEHDVKEIEDVWLPSYMSDDLGIFGKYSPGLLYKLMGLDISTELNFWPRSYRPEHFSNFEIVDEILTTTSADSQMEQLRASGNDCGWDFNDFVSVHSVWKSIFELTNMLHFSQASSSPLFVPSTAEIKVSHNPEYMNNSMDAVQLYRLYLTERRMLPNVTCLEDVLRLREDKRLKTFRKVLNSWMEISQGDDLKAIEEIRRDINKATSEISKLGEYQKFARLIGYISLPIAIADVIMGSPFGLLLAPIGPAVDLYSTLKLRKFGWLNFGR